MVKNSPYVVGNTASFEESHGFFMGHFISGTLGVLHNDEIEIAWKQFPNGAKQDREPHYHKVGLEINVVVEGSWSVIVEGSYRHVLEKGHFLVVPPGTSIQTVCIDPGTVIIVIKTPSVPNDKFPGTAN